MSISVTTIPSRRGIKCPAKNPCATHDPSELITNQLLGLFQGRNNIASGEQSVRARHDYVAPPGERTILLLKGLVRAPAHDHGMARGQPLEVSKVLGQVPGHRAIPADRPVVCLGPNSDETHTATGALIDGWCS